MVMVLHSHHHANHITVWTLPVVPHKAVAEVSKIGNLWERLVVVNRGWQSEPTDGSKGGWSVGLSICLSVYLSFDLSIYPSIHLSIHPSIHLSIYLSVSWSICPSAYLCIYLSINLSVDLQAWKRRYSARLLKLIVEADNQERSNPARLPQFLNSARELDSIENGASLQEFLHIWTLDNVKNVAIVRDFLNFRSWQRQKRSNSARLPSKMESWVQSWRPCTNAFCDFSTPPV